MRSTLKLTGCSVYWVIVGVVLLAGITTAYLFILPTWRGLETKSFQQSYGFVQSKQTLLLQLASDYDKLDAEIKVLSGNSDSQPTIDAKKVQQVAIRNRMKQEASLIPADQIPPSILFYLR